MNVSYKKQFKECLEFGILLVLRDTFFCTKYKELCSSKVCLKDRKDIKDPEQLNLFN